MSNYTKFWKQMDFDETVVIDTSEAGQVQTGADGSSTLYTVGSDVYAGDIVIADEQTTGEFDLLDLSSLGTAGSANQIVIDFGEGTITDQSLGADGVRGGGDDTQDPTGGQGQIGTTLEAVVLPDSELTEVYLNTGSGSEYSQVLAYGSGVDKTGTDIIHGFNVYDTDGAGSSVIDRSSNQDILDLSQIEGMTAAQLTTNATASWDTTTDAEALVLTLPNSSGGNFTVRLEGLTQEDLEATLSAGTDDPGILDSSEAILEALYANGNLAVPDVVSVSLPERIEVSESGTVVLDGAWSVDLTASADSSTATSVVLDAGNDGVKFSLSSSVAEQIRGGQLALEASDVSGTPLVVRQMSVDGDPDGDDGATTTEALVTIESAGAAGQVYTLTAGSESVSYEVQSGDTVADIANGLKAGLGTGNNLAVGTDSDTSDGTFTVNYGATDAQADGSDVVGAVSVDSEPTGGSLVLTGADGSAATVGQLKAALSGLVVNGGGESANDATLSAVVNNADGTVQDADAYLAVTSAINDQQAPAFDGAPSWAAATAAGLASLPLTLDKTASDGEEVVGIRVRVETLAADIELSDAGGNTMAIATTDVPFSKTTDGSWDLSTLAVGNTDNTTAHRVTLEIAPVMRQSDADPGQAVAERVGVARSIDVLFGEATTVTDGPSGVAGAANDTSDAMQAWAGDNPDTGGAARDTVNYIHSNAGVTVDLAAGRGSGGFAEGDTYSSIERVIGSVYDDTFISGNITGYQVFSGGAGNDLFVHGADADKGFYLGGRGVDTVDLSRASAGQTIDLGPAFSGAGTLVTHIENVVVSAHADSITLNNEANTVSWSGLESTEDAVEAFEDRTGPDPDGNPYNTDTLDLTDVFTGVRAAGSDHASIAAAVAPMLTIADQTADPTTADYRFAVDRDLDGNADLAFTLDTQGQTLLVPNSGNATEIETLLDLGVLSLDLGVSALPATEMAAGARSGAPPMPNVEGASRVSGAITLSGTEVQVHIDQLIPERYYEVGVGSFRATHVATDTDTALSVAQSLANQLAGAGQTIDTPPAFEDSDTDGTDDYAAFTFTPDSTTIAATAAGALSVTDDGAGTIAVSIDALGAVGETYSVSGSGDSVSYTVRAGDTTKADVARGLWQAMSDSTGVFTDGTAVDFGAEPTTGSIAVTYDTTAPTMTDDPMTVPEAVTVQAADGVEPAVAEQAVFRLEGGEAGGEYVLRVDGQEQVFSVGEGQTTNDLITGVTGGVDASMGVTAQEAVPADFGLGLYTMPVGGVLKRVDPDTGVVTDITTQTSLPTMRDLTPHDADGDGSVDAIYGVDGDTIYEMTLSADGSSATVDTHTPTELSGKVLRGISSADSDGDGVDDEFYVTDYNGTDHLYRLNDSMTSASQVSDDDPDAANPDDASYMGGVEKFEIVDSDGDGVDDTAYVVGDNFWSVDLASGAVDAIVGNSGDGVAVADTDGDGLVDRAYLGTSTVIQPVNLDGSVLGTTYDGDAGTSHGAFDNPRNVTAVDSDGDGIVDTLYAGDSADDAIRKIDLNSGTTEIVAESGDAYATSMLEFPQSSLLTFGVGAGESHDIDFFAREREEVSQGSQTLVDTASVADHYVYAPESLGGNDTLDVLNVDEHDQLDFSDVAETLAAAYDANGDLAISYGTGNGTTTVEAVMVDGVDITETATAADVLSTLIAEDAVVQGV